MKRLLGVMMITGALVACSNNGGETGVMNDGIEPFDSNGALVDSNGKGSSVNPSTDTAIGEDRVDIQQRGAGNPKVQDTIVNKQ